MRMLTSAPWLRAPLLLLRRPAVLAAGIGAALVLGVAAASAPLFLTSAANASLHSQIDNACGSTVGPSYHGGLPFTAGGDTGLSYVPPGSPVGPAALSAQLQAATPLQRLPRLRQVVTLDFRAQVAGAPSREAATVRVLSRTGSRNHVQLLRGGAGAGVLISDRSARTFRLGVGDALRLTGPDGKTAATRVAGVYRDLRDYEGYRDDYWCELTGLFYQNPNAAGPPPVFDVMLADQATTMRLAAATGQPGIACSFTYLVDDHALTTTKAADLLGRAAHAQAALVLQLTGTAAGSAPPPGQLTQFVRRAQLVQDALASTVTPIAVAGCVVALLVVGASASYWAERRRVEINVLVAHGVGPAALGLKAALEVLPAAAVGSVLGWLTSIGLVKLVGPSPLLSAGRPLQALWLTAAGFAAALVLSGVVAGLRVRAGERPIGSRRRWASLVPWELVLLAGGGILAGGLLNGRTVTDDLSLGSVAHVNPLLLVFPLLFFVGAVALVARLLALAVMRLRGRGSRWPTVPYLALRRVTGAPLVAVLLVAAAALPAAVALYGATVSASVRTTLEGEARLHIGADVVLALSRPAPVPAPLRGHAIVVQRYPGQHVGGLIVDLLGVDPATFLDAAYVDPTVGGPSPAALMRRISDPQPRPGDPVPALLVGGDLTGDQQLRVTSSTAPVTTVPVSIVGTPADFPSQGSSGALLVMDRRALATLVADPHEEVWAAGDEQRILAEAARSSLPVRFAYQASAVIDSGVYAPVTYTFDYLTALAVLAAAVGLGGLLLYLESRSRGRRLSYVIARRMGLRRASNLVSIALELFVVLVSGLLVGLGLAQAAAHAVAGSLDVDPESPPATILVTPYAALGVVALVVIVAVVLASLVAQRSLDRADTAEVLRGG